MDQESISSNEKTKVGFPEVQKEEPKKGKKLLTTLILLVLVVILAWGAWLIFSNKEEIIEFRSEAPTQAVEEIPTEEPTPTTIDKASLKVQILNGTGVPGEAGKLQDKLESLGYSNIDSGNADNYSYKAAEVTFSDNVPQTVKDELNDALSSMYSSVSEGNSSTSEFEVVIITGTAKSGSTTKKITATPTPKLSVTSGSTGTVTSALSKTPTP